MRSANMKRVRRPPAPVTDGASFQAAVGTLQKLKSNWQDALFGGMVLASFLGLIYVLTHR
jgi:hypothetical protein